MADIHTDYPPEITRLSDDGLVQYINEKIDHLHRNHNLPTMHMQDRNRRRDEINTAFIYFRHRLNFERQHAVDARNMMQDERNQVRADLEVAQGLLRFERDEKANLQAQYNQGLDRMQRYYRNRDRNDYNDLERRLRLIRDNLQARIHRLTGQRDNARAQTNNARNQYIFVYNQLGESNHQNEVLQFTTRYLTRIRDRLRAQLGALRIQVAWFRARAGPPVPPPPVRPPQILWIPRS